MRFWTHRTVRLGLAAALALAVGACTASTTVTSSPNGTQLTDPAACDRRDGAKNESIDTSRPWSGIDRWVIASGKSMAVTPGSDPVASARAQTHDTRVVAQRIAGLPDPADVYVVSPRTVELANAQDGDVAVAIVEMGRLGTLVEFAVALHPDGSVQFLNSCPGPAQDFARVRAKQRAAGSTATDADEIRAWATSPERFEQFRTIQTAPVGTTRAGWNDRTPNDRSTSDEDFPLDLRATTSRVSIRITVPETWTTGAGPLTICSRSEIAWNDCTPLARQRKDPKTGPVTRLLTVVGPPGTRAEFVLGDIMKPIDASFVAPLGSLTLPAKGTPVPATVDATISPRWTTADPAALRKAQGDVLSANL